MIKDILKEIEQKNMYASIHTNLSKMDRFTFGKILNCNDKHFVTNSYTPEGFFDGFILREIDCILQVVTENKYSAKMEKLIKEKNKVPQEMVSFDNDDLVFSMLSLSKKKNWIVAIEILNSGYLDSGFVVSINDDVCKLKQIDEYGAEDGYIYINIQDITEINCNTSDGMVLYELWKQGNIID